MKRRKLTLNLDDKMEDKTQYKAHLVKTKDAILEHKDSFVDVQQSQVDSDNFIIKNVCIAGQRQSANGYIYTDKAFESLTKLAEGARNYLDHPDSEMVKRTSGVRSVKDFGGVFHNIRRNENKVFGDLWCRESVFPLYEDIVKLQPESMGMSINSRVKVYVDNEGKESIVDIDILHGIDLVSSASLTKSLWESVDEAKLQETEKQEQSDIDNRIEAEEVNREIFKDLINRVQYTEGIIADQMVQDEIRHKTNEVIWKASDMVYDVIRDKEMAIKEKKDKVTKILDDLDSEIRKRIKKIKTSEEEQKPESEQIRVVFPTVVLPDQQN